MNNIMDQINMKNLNEPMENFIINNNINNINEGFEGPKITVIFEKHSGLKTVINASIKKSVNALFNLYRLKIGEDEILQNCYFICNGRKMNPNESTSLLDYGIKNGQKIIVEKKELLGGPSIILKIISNGNWDIKLDGMILNNYLIKYFDKIGKSNLKKTNTVFTRNTHFKFF